MNLQNLCRQVAIGTVLAFPIASFNVASALAGQQDFTMVNDTDLVMTNLYVSSANSSNWGRDRLGDSVLQSHDEFFVEFNNNSNQCLWDIKAVYEDGSYDKGQFNLCETNTVRVWGYGGEYGPDSGAISSNKY
ncbi:MAG TPA: hypothetical protein DEG17_26580 [Cyanobacteria bacterium UBA11149]|nr:hypothetical protein [Cyanobacteria bacterium UBA11366]HBR72608.1 hypothetical protein [Cyanobacteria bacterium UBA11159]HBS71179.1 hypothetical protein [Cyanobacteria bacterium UBA11153]HBW92335.1 hypothetical protein [Cyanobacteria bacterium UBA11149]HCA96379.1 hypothetical protein [Cyanobacteria bacterium UBA9226]